MKLNYCGNSGESHFLSLLLLFFYITTMAEQGHAQISVSASAGSLTGNYITLNGAFAAINAGTHQGSIRITVTDNTIEPPTPNSLLGSGVGSANYTRIYIRPSGGNWTINAAAAPTIERGIIELFGAQNVTIDGDDPLTPGSQNLTFSQSIVSTGGVACIRLGSANANATVSTAAGGAANDTIRNCIILGAKDSANSTDINYGIAVTGASTTGITAAVASYCDNLAFINNTINRCYYGLYMYGYTTATAAETNTNTTIAYDTIGSQIAANSTIYGIYMYYFNSSNTSISSNIFGNDICANDSAPLVVYGLYSDYNKYLSLYNNNIHDMTTSSAASDIYGMYINGSNSTIAISGNILQDITASDASSDIYGISVSGTISSQTIHDNILQNWDGQEEMLGINASNLDCYNNTLANFTTTNGDIDGISSGGSANVYQNTVTNLQANYNITGISAANGTVYGNNINNLIGLTANNSITGINIGAAHVYNNFVGNISATTTDTLPFSGFAAGITFGNPSTFDNNTIALNTPNQPGTVANAFSACISGTTTGTFRNNILVNTQSSTNATGIYVQTAATWSTNESNNDIYIPSGVVANAGGTIYASMSQWQSATGREVGSISISAPFISIYDLHIDSTNVNAISLYETGIYSTSPATPLTDIDNRTRPIPPSMGAAEFRLPGTCLSPTGLITLNITDSTATLIWHTPASGSAVGYNWEVRTSGAATSGPPGLVASGSTTAPDTSATVSGLLRSTTYYLYVQTDCGGGSYSSWAGPLAFTTPSGPPTAVLSGTDGTICNGASVRLTITATGTGPFSGKLSDSTAFSGSSPITVMVIPTTAPVTYRIAWLSNTTQSALPSGLTGSVTITAINPLPTVTATGIPDSVCSGDSVTLSQSGLSSFRWSPGGQTMSPLILYPSVTTAFDISGIDSNGCHGSASMIVTVTPTPPVSTITQTGNALNSSASIGNQWYLNGNPVNGATSQSYIPTADGSYTVTVTTGMCSSTSAPFVFNLTGMEVMGVNPSLSVYPNPAKDNIQLTVSRGSGSPYHLIIIDEFGRNTMCAEGSFSPAGPETISVEKLSAGTYCIEIITAENTYVQRLVKE